MFQNKNEIHYFLISSKSIQNNGWNENTGIYNPPVADITYQDIPDNKDGIKTIRYREGNTIIQDASLLTIYKNGSTQEIS